MKQNLDAEIRNKIQSSRTIVDLIDSDKRPSVELVEIALKDLGYLERLLEKNDLSDKQIMVTDEIGNSWINYFAESLKELEHESAVKGSSSWTAFLTRVMHLTGTKMDCYVQSKNAAKDMNSGEYLNIDALFFKNKDCKSWNSDYAPPIFPFAAVELENDYAHTKIAYCLWKIICIRCGLRVLICHQPNIEKVFLLKKYLEKILKNNDLFLESKGDLYVVISDETSGKSTWKEYYSVFQWQNDKFEKIRAFD